MKEISAGGVVFRKREGQLEIQLIQDRYGKVSLAKGKMEPGETIEETALREVVEETGIHGRIIEPIDMIKYQYNHPEHGLVDKEVHYYLIEEESGSLQAQVEEIRGVSWFSPEAAWQQQKQSGYDNNDIIVSKAFQKLGLSIGG
ncbi:NUDIX hydrolase [Paenibacillus assamensis]|uniref:NUDIX hydrolase n=1 Tax=Paenibacillus assamensis TaxID=311244 RepID=UPI00041AA93A|nr:NUDIX domain-containing protein [Paenibacillus assamensis]